MTDKQLTEVSDLLKPRYKVIADDTSGNFEVGEIIYVDDSGHSLLYTDNGRLRIHLDSYPHLFKRLEWWEERSQEELSGIGYLKSNAGNSIRKVLEIDYREGVVVVLSATESQAPTTKKKLRNWIPSTKEEYESFINQIR